MGFSCINHFKRLIPLQVKCWTLSIKKQTCFFFDELLAPWCSYQATTWKYSTSLHDCDAFYNRDSLWQRPSISHQHTGARMSVKRRRNHKWAFIEVCPAAATVHGTLMWSHHVGAGTSKRHVSGVKLKSVDGSWMFPIQHSHLHPTLSAPNMDSPVLWACTTRHILTQMSQE